MEQDKLQAARKKVLVDRMEGNRRFLLKEYGMEGAERFRIFLLHNKEIDQLPEPYQYLHAIEYLMDKIEKDSDGCSYLPEEELFKYYRTPYFQKVVVRMDMVIALRNI
jgi:hypothetical protein